MVLVSDFMLLKIRGYYYDELRDCVVHWKLPEKEPSGKVHQIGVCRQSLSVYIKIISKLAQRQL